MNVPIIRGRKELSHAYSTPIVPWYVGIEYEFVMLL